VLVDLREYVQILRDFLVRFSSASDCFVQMVKRSRTIFCIDLPNIRDGFVNVIAGDKASGESFELTKTSGENL
jgi:hypothetical protein